MGTGFCHKSRDNKDSDGTHKAPHALTVPGRRRMTTPHSPRMDAMTRTALLAVLLAAAAPAGAAKPHAPPALPPLVTASPTIAGPGIAAPSLPAPGTAPVPVGFLNAADLRDHCLSNSPPLASSCFSYITGVHDTVRAYEAWLNLREYCVTAATTQSDLRDAFLAYIQRAPEHAYGEAASVVVVALKQAFPCGAARAKR